VSLNDRAVLLVIFNTPVISRFQCGWKNVLNFTPGQTRLNKPPYASLQSVERHFSPSPFTPQPLCPPPYPAPTPTFPSSTPLATLTQLTFVPGPLLETPSSISGSGLPFNHSSGTTTRRLVWTQLACPTRFTLSPRISLRTSESFTLTPGLRCGRVPRAVFSLFSSLRLIWE
jgi:hypothetical protein